MANCLNGSLVQVTDTLSVHRGQLKQLYMNGMALASPTSLITKVMKIIAFDEILLRFLSNP